MSITNPMPSFSALLEEAVKGREDCTEHYGISKADSRRERPDLVE